MEPKEQRKVDDSSSTRWRRPTQALDDAGWHPKSYEDQIATGVMIGSGIGGIEGIAETAVMLHEKRPAPGLAVLHSRAGSSISPPAMSRSRIGLKGPNHAVVTACSTGAHAIGDAGRLIALGDADVMVAGGAESPVNRLSLAGFAACRALSTGFNDTPDARLAALRPRPRRLRHGRGRRRRRARGIRARQGARRQDLRRADRLRPVGRRLSHHRAGARTATAPSAA